MAIKKCQCGTDYETEGFKTLCPVCYAKSMNGKKSLNGFKSNNKEQDIHRQVFLKVASEQLRGVSVTEIIKYAKQLEIQYNNWI